MTRASRWLLATTCAASIGLAAAAVHAAGTVEVLHWWTSGGEAKAVGELKKAFEWKVEVGGGAAGILRFPIPEEWGGKVERFAGARVMLGLRPETITRQGVQAPARSLFAFERPVEVVEPTGPDTMLVFDVAGSEMIARVRPEDSAPAGTLFPFEANMAKAKLFDAATGSAI